MEKVFQTRFGRPGGNCFQASIASLLGIKLSCVPDFCNECDEPFGWFRSLSDWCLLQGLAVIYIELKNPPYATVMEGPCILGVRLKCHGEGDTAIHAVVGKSELVGEEWRHTVVHDPHPYKPEIISITDVTFIVRNAAPL